MFQVVEVKFLLASADAVPPRVVRKFTKRHAAKEYADTLNRKCDLVDTECIISYFVKEIADASNLSA